MHLVKRLDDPERRVHVTLRPSGTGKICTVDKLLRSAVLTLGKHPLLGRAVHRALPQEGQEKLPARLVLESKAMQAALVLAQGKGKEGNTKVAEWSTGVERLEDQG
jgi:hypothetical protein